MDNQKQKKKKSVMDTLSATMVLVLIALLLVFVGYTYLALKNGYTLDDLIAVSYTHLTLPTNSLV